MKYTVLEKTNKKKKSRFSSPPDCPSAAQKDCPLPVLKRRALLLSAFVLFLCLLSCLLIFLRRGEAPEKLTARIYQDGLLMQSIDLHAVTQPYTITISAPDGGYNTLEIRPDAIGIIDADCPDRLCIATGFASSTRLPIVCLPHRLVIQLYAGKQAAPDGISY